MHSTVSGVTDHLADDDAHALAIARRLVSRLADWPARRWQPDRAATARNAPQADIHRYISHDARHPSDNREVLLRLVDDSAVRRVQTAVRRHADVRLRAPQRLSGGGAGQPWRAVQRQRDQGSALHRPACKRDVPLLFLADVTTGFMVGREAEQKAASPRRAPSSSPPWPRPRCLATPSSPAAPTGPATGDVRPTVQPDAMFAWPNGRAAIMGPEQAATTLALVREQILRAAASLG